MSGCSNKGRDALMPTLRIEVDLSDGRTLHRDLALNGCEVEALRLNGTEHVPRQAYEPKWVLQGETQTQEFWRCECGNCGESFGVESRETFPFKMTVGKVDAPNFCPRCGAEVVQ